MGTLTSPLHTLVVQSAAGVIGGAGAGPAPLKRLPEVKHPRPKNGRGRPRCDVDARFRLFEDQTARPPLGPAPPISHNPPHRGRKTAGRMDEARQAPANDRPGARGRVPTPAVRERANHSSHDLIPSLVFSSLLRVLSPLSCSVRAQPLAGAAPRAALAAAGHTQPTTLLAAAAASAVLAPRVLTRRL